MAKNPINGGMLKILGFVLLVISLTAGAVAYVHSVAGELRTERAASFASKDAVEGVSKQVEAFRAEQAEFRREIREDLRGLNAKIDALASPK